MVKKIKKELYIAILVLISISVGFIISELVLYILDIPHFYKPHSIPAQFSYFQNVNGTALWRNYPSTCIRFIYDGNPRGYFGKYNEVDHNTNSYGFRGHEFSEIKPRNTFRIAFLGDSFTFGEGVRDTDTYAERTSMLLAEKHNPSPVVFESYNFGVGGYSFIHELFILEDIVLKMDPDLVVFKLDVGDFETSILKMNPQQRIIYRDYRWYEDPKESIFSLPPNSIFFRLRLLKLLWQQLHVMSQNKKSVVYYNSLLNNAYEGWSQNRNALHAAIKICHEKNIPCYVLCFPVLYRLDNSYPFSNAHSIMRKEVESEGVMFIDLFSYLKGYECRKLWVHPTDRHPNEKVHELAAGVLVDAITTSNVIDLKIQALP